jgi:hypothetical protein
MTFNATFCTSNSLSSDSPKQTFAFITIRRTGSSPGLKIMGCRTWYRINQCLQSLLINMSFLLINKRWESYERENRSEMQFIKKFKNYTHQFLIIKGSSGNSGCQPCVALCSCHCLQSKLQFKIFFFFFLISILNLKFLNIKFEAKQ